MGFVVACNKQVKRSQSLGATKIGPQSLRGNLQVKSQKKWSKAETIRPPLSKKIDFRIQAWGVRYIYNLLPLYI